MTGKRSSLRIFKPHIRMHKALKESPNENRFNYCTLSGNQEAGRRNKVDGSLTSRPGRESDSELSATGPASDPYSAFGVQRNLGAFPL
jgi:hypothetical protein